MNPHRKDRLENLFVIKISDISDFPFEIKIFLVGNEIIQNCEK